MRRRYRINKEYAAARQAYNKKYRAEHPEYFRQKRKEWAQKNPEKVKASQKVVHKRYRKRNPEKHREQERLRYLRNPEKINAHVSAWKAKNPHKARAAVARRKSHVARATPEWADRNAINEVYALAIRLAKETSVRHHVDHIIPLRGKTVCGLHVPANLQVIPAVENLRKGAKCDLASVDSFNSYSGTRSCSSRPGLALR